MKQFGNNCASQGVWMLRFNSEYADWGVLVSWGKVGFGGGKVGFGGEWWLEYWGSLGVTGFFRTGTASLDSAKG